MRRRGSRAEFEISVDFSEAVLVRTYEQRGKKEGDKITAEGRAYMIQDLEMLNMQMDHDWIIYKNATLTLQPTPYLQ